MTAEVNPMPVFTYNRYYVTTYSWSYRYGILFTQLKDSNLV